MTLSKLDNLKN